ncbi:MAG: reverse transcriptase family protein, partial [gamma proteobacterium symbiont of Lucinoma myriamae]|nr:reverse transcriptase family protein [gamma proteobacterium symbiont of Lucinoma myriamae]
SKVNGNFDQYKILRNKVSTLINNSKQNMYQVQIEEGKDNPRTIWKLFRKFGASGKGQSQENIHGVKLNDEVVSSDKEIADIFNNFFVNVAAQLKEPIRMSEFQNLKSYVDSKVHPDTFFHFPEINETFVKKFLSSLDTTKATGLDCIGPRLLKLAPNVLAPSITFIINISLTAGRFPSIWKHARVNPIFKSGSKDEVDNYRPISILPTLSKLIEKWVNIKFTAFLNLYELLHQRQSGFREGHSTESALTLMIDTWLKAINDGLFVGCVMVDFRKAFDMVDHKILLKKLSLYKCSDLCLSWFDSYLSNRSQTVSVNGIKSDNEQISCGVPQGSILGPLLFLVFINDLPLTMKNILSATDLYADDTTLYDIQADKTLLEENLQTALHELQNWCKENGMLLNTNKTKVMFLTSRQKRVTLTNNVLKLNYDGIELQLSSNEKVLGVNIDENFIWNTHFMYVSKKVSSHLWLLSQIKNYLPLKHRVLFYNAYIKPHLEYCSIIWGNSSGSNINRLNKLQRRACKIILGNSYTNLVEARNHLNILSFEESLFLQKAKTMYKIANNIAPQYLIDLFQLRSNNMNNTTLNLRSMSNRNFMIPKPRTDLYKRSLAYSGAIVWNSIPLEIKSSSTLQSFINKCTSWMKSSQ